MKNKIIIVTGISNSIGMEYMRYYSYDDDHMVIGISRTHLCNYGFYNSHEVQIDLLQASQVESKLSAVLADIEWDNIQECIVVHTCGKVKNDELGIHEIEDKDGDGLDDEMYNAQIVTFVNLHQVLVDYLIGRGVYETITITLVGFVSLTDRKKSSIHKSMRAVNNVMRKLFHKLGTDHFNYRTFVFALSTVATAKEIEYRKFADQTFWLLPAEVRSRTMFYINNMELMGHIPVDVFHDHPLYKKLFKKETNEQTRQRYMREIGLVGDSS